MGKTPKRPKARRIKANPVARELRTPKYRQRVAKPSGAYRRPPKVRPGGEDSGE